MQILNRTSTLFQRLIQIFKPRFFYAFGTLIILFSLFITFVPATTEWLELYLYDFKHRISAAYRIPDSSLVVVGIDMKTLAKSKNRWPWPRDEVAQAIELLGSLNPRGIIIDILFQNEDTESGDFQLENTIKNQGNLLLISILEEKQSSLGINLARFTSLRRFSDKALGEGFVWGVIDKDGLLRQFKTFDDRLNARSVAKLAFEHFFQNSPYKDNPLPETVPIVFARKNGGVPVLSLYEIMKNEDDYREFCKDKVLILGVNAQAAHDYHNSPIGIIAGAEILAASIDTIVSGRIGRLWFSSPHARVFSVFSGLLIAWLTVMSSISLLFIPFIFAMVMSLLMLVTEITLIHLPLAPLFVSWFVSCLVLIAARYFDNLFSLREMQHEAVTARLVQEQLLPAEELITKDYKIVGLSRSANELGGDYFDYFIVKDRHILVIIGDATGHGVPAALAMAIGKATVLMGLEQNLDPVKLIESVNVVLFKALRRKLMMTAAFLWIDTETHEFEYYNCGHPYPYRIAENGFVDQIAASGLFLGTKASYRPAKPFRGVMNKGERLLLYTDGLVESISIDNDQDGFLVFAEYIKVRPKLPLKEACVDLIQKHPFFLTNKPQPDDFTVLLVERLIDDVV